MADLFGPAAVVFWQQIVNGLTIGAFYALIALGYTMVYGIIRLINFPHGDIFSLGAFLTLTLAQVLAGGAGGGLAFALALLAATAVAAVAVGFLGVSIEHYAYRPLRGRSRLTPLISAIGVSFLVQNGIMLVWGADFRVYPEVPNEAWTVAGARLTSMQLVIFAATVALMAGLHLFVHRTRLGTAMRATAIDHDTARLMGINVDRVIAVTFFVGSVLAAVTGVMVGLYYRQISFFMGYVYGLKAFTAAVMGGIGNIPGAMLGGLLLGVLETLAAGYFAAEWKDVIAFAILIAVLIFKPTGLLGERVGQSV
jgi:branched-chain amino acid transport system permease protein